MKWLCGLLMVIASFALARAEVVLEFDGSEWGVGIEGADIEARVLKEGICFVADGASRVGDLFDEWDLEKFQPHAIRFSVRGAEGKGAVIDSAEGLDGLRTTSIAVSCEPELMVVAYLDQEARPVNGSESMDADMNGAADFLAKVEEGVEFSKGKKEIPMAVLMIRPKCSYGLMVRVLQMIRASGCRNTLIKIDDEFPSLDFKVLVDPDVVPPLSDMANQDPRGRIVLNLSGDGSVKGEDRQVLKTDDEIKRYVERCRDEIVKSGKDPRLFLRGGQEDVFRFSRRVIRIGSAAGVDQVIFAVYGKPNEANDDVGAEQKEQVIELRATDLGMEVPKNLDLGRVVVLHIEKEGRILLEEPERVLDVDPKEREVPLLKAALEKLKAGEGAISLKIRVDKDVPQQRVIDVLNACASVGISIVTFLDED